MNTWFKDKETGNISHWCAGIEKNEDVKTGNIKPKATHTQASFWFHPAEPIEAEEDKEKTVDTLVKCGACGEEANATVDQFETIGV